VLASQEIIVFKNQQLTYYTGNYDEYRQQVEERQLHQQRLADGIERKRDHMEKRWAGGQEEGRSQGPAGAVAKLTGGGVQGGCGTEHGHTWAGDLAVG
jgi:ATPase subunit of ABC transporter with duplicated ATPase domains